MTRITSHNNVGRDVSLSHCLSHTHMMALSQGDNYDEHHYGIVGPSVIRLRLSYYYDSL